MFGLWRRRTWSRSTAPPPFSAMSDPWEAGRASLRARSSSSSHSNMAPIESLPDDLLLDILSRLPPKYVCRFKCASKHCLGFVDHPDNRKNLPQSLAGFFYNSKREKGFPISAPQFVNASGRGRPFINPSLAFLPNRRRLHLLDCCNGLILCRLYTRGDKFRYVVCNPATEEWVALPDGSQARKMCCVRLGFDPAASSHFHVFLLLLDADKLITGVDVYSSETGGWIHKDERWNKNVRLADPPSATATVFFNRYLHLCTFCLEWRPLLSVVDTKGTWSNFESPGLRYGGELQGADPFLAFIQQSQGQLHYASFRRDYDDDDEDYDDDDVDGDNKVQLQVYALENYALENYAEDGWTVKHTVELSHVDVFGGFFEGKGFGLIGIHPAKSNLIYFNEGSHKTLKCYNMMNRQEATEVCTLADGQPTYFPYVPLYSKLNSLSM